MPSPVRSPALSADDHQQSAAHGRTGFGAGGAAHDQLAPGHAALEPGRRRAGPRAGIALDVEGSARHGESGFAAHAALDNDFAFGQPRAQPVGQVQVPDESDPARRASPSMLKRSPSRTCPSRSR